jgi:hypothetical protein
MSWIEITRAFSSLFRLMAGTGKKKGPEATLDFENA